MRVLAGGGLAAGLLVLTSGCPSQRVEEMETFSGPGTNASTSGSGTGDATTEIDPTDPDSSSGLGPDGCLRDQDCVVREMGERCDLATGACYEQCVPAETRPCYSGPAGTDGVGICQAGTNLCNDMGRWVLDCTGEVIPETNDCDNNRADDDCDGLIDDTDADGDGFGVCLGNDCCDVSGGACSDAELVNPGAYEVVGNNLDDNCDGEIDEVTNSCDSNVQSNTSNAADFAKAMELCAVTEEKSPAPEERGWGLISASLTLADGTGAPLPVQHSVRRDFGDIIEPEEGASMAVLSTGHAADQADVNPPFAPFQGGMNLGTSVPAPADWLDANEGTFPNPAGCLEPSSAEAHDSAMLTLRLRAPTNARSFSVKMNFFSAEYPEWVCSEYNDFFVTLVDPAVEGNPADGNIAIYDDGEGKATWPVGVNLVMIADGLFTQCENGPVGCSSDLDSNYSGCVGTALLEGTGFDLPDNGCDGPNQTQVGGATGWLKMSGNVEPGEIFDIRFAIWDTSGYIFDSLVLLDDWTWSLDAATPGVVPG